jgi:hypothetical protein
MNILRKIIVCAMMSVLVTLSVRGNPHYQVWKDSFDTFIQEVVRWGGNKPAASVSMMASGQLVSERWEIMQKFGRETVTWEGVFEGVGEGELLLSDDGAQKQRMDKIEIKLPSGVPTIVHAYATPASLQAWKNVAKGKRVSFQARVGGIGLFGPLMDRIFYVITLKDLSLVKVLD